MSERMADIVSSLVLLAFSFFMIGELENVPPEGVYFPRTVLIAIAVCSFLLMARAFFLRSGKVKFFAGTSPAVWAAGVLMFLLWAWGCMYVHFYLFMFLGLFCMMLFLGGKINAVLTVMYAIIAGMFLAFFYFFFTVVMHIYFPV